VGMEVTTRWHAVGPLLLTAAFILPRVDLAPERAQGAKQTLQAVGRRLSRSKSASALGWLALDGHALLEQLRPAERAVLALDHLRFKAEAPVVVDVAAPVGSIPFWLADQGFHATDLTLENPDTSWAVFRRTFEPGWIGLGVNGLDRTPVAHYVVFVRPSPRSRPEPRRFRTDHVAEDSSHEPARSCRSATGPVVGLDARDERNWKATIARPGASAAHDAYRPFRVIPGELLGATLLQSAQALRHSALLATGRVWKTHAVSSLEPDQVTISFGSDPARELVWSWRTSPEVTSTSLRIVRARSGAQGESCQGAHPFDRAGARVFVVSGEAETIESPNVLNDPVTLRHRVVVTGLEPDSTYWYSLGRSTPEGWGPCRTVKTAPDRARGLKFLYLGDPQTGFEAWGRLLQSACNRHPGMDFILIGGDLVDRGNERTNWDHFFLRAAEVFARVPLMPCAGNHEYLDAGPRLYRAFFELPRNGPPGIDPDLVYHFECGDACFAVLDSTLAVSNSALAQRQAEWLDGVLGKTGAAWKFVMFHHPVYPSHPWRDTPVLRERWVPIFDKHHVDFVLQGHDHAYLRTYPMRAHRRAVRPGEGTFYVIAVSGDKFVDQPRREYIEVGKTGLSTYQTFKIDPGSGTLTYQAWAQDGTLVDEVRIDKRRTLPPSESLYELAE
jgi:acid phosphatase type 7